MLFACHPKILHKHCLKFLLRVKMASRETENNAYKSILRAVGYKTVIGYCASLFK